MMMTNTKDRKKLEDILDNLLPEMAKYKKMPMVNNVPFAMNAGAFNYQSKTINTDKDGFRLSRYQNEYVSLQDIDKFDNVNILIGNSTTFGVGVSNDDYTLTSILSKKTNEPWFNISIRGAVALTEYIHAIRYIYKARNVKNIIIFSGIVDIYLNLLLDKPSDFEKRIEPERWLFSCEKRIISRFFANRYKLRQLDIIDKSIKDLLFYPFSKKKFIDNGRKLTKDEQLDYCIDNLKKIFFLYAALKKQLDTNVVYMLQPFYHWCNKKSSTTEKEVFEILKVLEKGTFWDRTRVELDNEIYHKIVNRLQNESMKCGIKFIDTNILYNTEGTLFADSVHFTDKGSQYTAEIIYKYINNK